MPNNTIYKPQAPNPKESICNFIYLLCTRAFLSRRHLRSFILTVQSEIGLQCTKFRSKTSFINYSKIFVLLFYLKNRRHFVLAPLLDLTVFSAYGNLNKLKNEKNTLKLTEIAIHFVKIRYNRPQL